MMTCSLHGVNKAEALQSYGTAWLTFSNGDGGSFVTVFMSMVLAEHLAREFNRGMNGLDPRHPTADDMPDTIDFDDGNITDEGEK